MVHAIHPLTPGTPAYALLKLGALAGVVGLQVVVRRRGRGRPGEDAQEPPPAAPPRAPHPRSRKKRRRRRR